jgi:hypothetical protein
LVQLNIPRTQWSRVRLRLERVRRMPDVAHRAAHDAFGAFITWRAESVRLGHTDNAVVLTEAAARAVRASGPSLGIYVIDNTALPPG